MKRYKALIYLKNKGTFHVSVEADSEYAARRLLEAQYPEGTITNIHED